MSIFRRREPPLPKAAVCFSSPAMTRYAADWLKDLGGCKTLGVLSDDCADVVWQCTAEQADLLLLGTDFTFLPAATSPSRCGGSCRIAASILSARTATRKSWPHWIRRWS